MTVLVFGENGTVLDRRGVKIIKVANEAAEWLEIGYSQQQPNACMQETAEIRV